MAACFTILADTPFVDEDIPQPRAYGDMVVTATSRRANHNEQPKKRDTTPRRGNTPRRAPSRRRHASPRPAPASASTSAGPPRVFAPFQQPPVPPPTTTYDSVNDAWAEPTPEIATHFGGTISGTQAEQDDSAESSSGRPRNTQSVCTHDGRTNPTTRTTCCHYPVSSDI